MLLPMQGQQEFSGLEDYYETNLRTNRTGMYTLGTWAVGNIAIGAYGWSQNSGETKYFHQMNTLWNTVNLGLAIGGLLGSKTLPSSKIELLEHSRRMERIFLINAGLDVLYMGTGAYLLNIDLADSGKRSEQYEGYGKSLILQGAFLFIFDLVMYGIKKGQRQNFMKGLRISPASDMTGIKISYQW